MKDLIAAAEREYEISEGDLLRKTRATPYPEARQLVMYICRENLKLSWSHIGRAFKVDHSTVIYSVKKMTVWLSLYEETQYHYSRILTAVGLSDSLESTSIH